LYKKLVYEKQIAQAVTASQYSLLLGSIFQIEATARPGHTLDELEKAIDEELDALARDTARRSGESIRRATRSRTQDRPESREPGGVATV
jgi:zinc protease